jgi:hypothetical protein
VNEPSGSPPARKEQSALELAVYGLVAGTVALAVGRFIGGWPGVAAAIAISVGLAIAHDRLLGGGDAP